MPPSHEPVNPAAERSAAPPDPAEAGTLDDLAERLRLLKVWAGDPSFERITERVNAGWRAAGRPDGELASKTTVVRCFEPGRRRMNPDLLVAVVQALHPDTGYVTQWRQALRVIGGEIEAASQVRVQDRLPEDLASFTGRTAELDLLREALHQARHDGGSVVISAIAGMAGVGKTQLAVRAGHLLTREMPDTRVLFVNLRGFHPDPAQPPADPSAVLDGFLRLLGVPGRQIPHDLPARTAAYRDRLAGTRTLVVLDNAADVEQVGPLLPEVPGCPAVVTSRRSLSTLPSAIHLTVDVYAPDEAVAFLAAAVPDVPVGADPHAAARIADRCSHLPLAVGLVAAHIRGTPGWTLTDHADRLDERHRQRLLDGGVQLALDLSYQHLPTEQQRLLRLAALHPGQDLDVYAAAALTDVDVPTAATMLEHLCGDHLLQRATSDRYVFHDLVRAYAATRAGDLDPPPLRRAALTRLFDFYLATTAAAAHVAYPHEQQYRPAVAPAGSPMPDLTDRKLAESWLDTELPNLLAAARHAANHGWPDHAWQLSATVDRHLRTRARHRDAETLHQRALQLARDLANPRAEMKALNSLAEVHRWLDRYELAADHFGQALRIAEDIGDRVGELNALIGLGYGHWVLGGYEQAADRLGRALRIARDIGDRFGERNALTALGDLHQVLGRYEQAAGDFSQALQIAQDIGDRVGQRSALTGLGQVHLALGGHEEAADHYERALQIVRDIGDQGGELYALDGLGAVHRTLGRHREAADCYQQVFDLAQALGNRNWQYEALQGLGRVHHAAGRPDLALVHHEQALQYATDLAQPPDQARAHDGLAHAHHALGQDDLARPHWREALDILTGLGTDHTEEVETSVPNIRTHLADIDHPPRTG